MCIRDRYYGVIQICKRISFIRPLAEESINNKLVSDIPFAAYCSIGCIVYLTHGIDYKTFLSTIASMRTLAQEIAGARSSNIYDQVDYTKASLFQSLKSDSISVNIVEKPSDIDAVSLQPGAMNVIDIKDLKYVESTIAYVEGQKPAAYGRVWASINDGQAQYYYLLTSYQLAGLLASFVAVLIVLMAVCLTIDLQAPKVFARTKLEYGKVQE